MICLFDGIVGTKSGELIQDGVRISLTIDEAKNLVRTLSECIEEALEPDHNGYVMELMSSHELGCVEFYVKGNRNGCRAIGVESNGGSAGSSGEQPEGSN